MWGASLVLLTFSENELSATSPPLSTATIVRSKLPTWSFSGMPLKVPVAESNTSQLGRAVPSARVTDKLKAASSGSLNASSGKRQVNDASSFSANVSKAAVVIGPALIRAVKAAPLSDSPDDVTTLVGGLTAPPFNRAMASPPCTATKSSPSSFKKNSAAGSPWMTSVVLPCESSMTTLGRAASSK